MAYIEIVIKISEDTFFDLKKKQNRTEVDNAVLNGILLPKGHGRLIDADVLPLNAIDDANYGSNYIMIAHTIIEADTESEEIYMDNMHPPKDPLVEGIKDYIRQFGVDNLLLLIVSILRGMG